MDPAAYFAAMDLRNCEMLIFAPRGTGASTPPPSVDGYRIAGYIDDVESLRCHLELDALRLYGHSHGGMVALAYACTYPERVARFVITNTPARMDAQYRDAVSETRQRFAEALPDGAERLAAADSASDALDAGTIGEQERKRAFRTLMARYVARQGSAETAYLDRLCAAPMNWDAVDPMYAEMLDGLDLLEGAAAVKAPALVIAGEFDVTVPPAVMRLISDALPAAHYVEFPDVGHFVEVEAAEEFRTTVSEFFDQ